jgi:2,3-bisphosphoglycerate-independent phosphoglycerate mutase
MKDVAGGPDTAHTGSDVPFTITDKSIVLRDDGTLSDVASTVLDLLGVPQPPEMTGRCLFTKK